MIGRALWLSEFVKGETMGRLFPSDAPPGRLAAFADALATIHETDWRRAGLAYHCPLFPADRVGAA